MRLHHATLALGIGAALLASAAPVSGQGEMPRPAAPAARPWPPARTRRAARRKAGVPRFPALTR
jgi:hypothetical protein